MKIIYRISDVGYKKEKPNYVNNYNCLKNALEVFSNDEWIIIADNVSNETKLMIENLFASLFPESSTKYKVLNVSVGHGAGTFNLALNESLKFEEDEIVYFLENDYIHREESNLAIRDAFSLGADYVSLYDHPDKYIPANRGGNPLVDVDGGELTKVFLGKKSHWKLTNSTTMTFAAKVKTLKEDESVLRKWTNTKHPHDMQMFFELREKGRTLVSSIPGYSTHGETKWLSPLIDWSEI